MPPKAFKTSVLTVTGNAQNTLQHFHGQVLPRPCLRTPMLVICVVKWSEFCCEGIWRWWWRSVVLRDRRVIAAVEEDVRVSPASGPAGARRPGPSARSTRRSEPSCHRSWTAGARRPGPSAGSTRRSEPSYHRSWTAIRRSATAFDGAGTAARRRWTATRSRRLCWRRWSRPMRWRHVGTAGWSAAAVETRSNASWDV